MISQKPVELPAALMNRASGGDAVNAVNAVIVGADRHGVLEGVKRAVNAGLIRPVLVGDRETIMQIGSEIDLPLDGVEIIDASGDEQVSKAAAHRTGAGDQQMVVKGHINTNIFMSGLITAKAGIRRRGRRMSHCFHMTVPGNASPLIITDAAINIAPNARTKKASILNAIDLAQAIGIARPKLALLSATETPSPLFPSSMEAAELTAWALQCGLDADVFGPMAFDNAVSSSAARLKGVENPVAGQADILLVPNIETGNALFKMMVHFMSACAAGVVLGGQIPIVLTSRADPPEARLASVALAKLCAAAGRSST